MLYDVYKSLDNPASFLGLKGSYLRFAAAGIGIALVVAFIIGSLTNGLVGILSFVAVTAFDYMGVMAFQAKYTERERKKWFASRKLPDVICFEPKAMSALADRRLRAARQIRQKNK